MATGAAEACLTCEAARVIELIGPQGATIKRLQAENGVKISVVSDAARPFASVSITGSNAATVAATVRAVEAIVNTPTAVLTCDAASVRLLIGPQGANIKRLQADSGAHIKVNSDRGAPFATILVSVCVCLCCVCINWFGQREIENGCQNGTCLEKKNGLGEGEWAI